MDVSDLRQALAALAMVKILYPLYRGLVGPQAQSRRMWRRESLSSTPEFEPRMSNPYRVSVSTVFWPPFEVITRECPCKVNISPRYARVFNLQADATHLFEINCTVHTLMSVVK